MQLSCVTISDQSVFALAMILRSKVIGTYFSVGSQFGHFSPDTDQWGRQIRRKIMMNCAWPFSNNMNNPFGLIHAGNRCGLCFDGTVPFSTRLIKTASEKLMSFFRLKQSLYSFRYWFEKLTSYIFYFLSIANN